MTTQAALWGGGVVALVIAMLAAWRDRRRRTRADLDRIGAVDWRNVQMLALIVLAALGYLLWQGASRIYAASTPATSHRRV